MSHDVVLITARALADPGGQPSADGEAPAAVLLADGPLPEVLAAGTAQTVDAHPAAAASVRLELPRSLLIPALVNAHTHLDLTDIGPRPYSPTGGFPTWARMIRDSRPSEPEQIRNSVREGIARSLAGGVMAVGDIAGNGRPEPLEALRESPLHGVSYLELFGLGTRQRAALDRVRRLLTEYPEHFDRGSRRVRFGLQPHAPYSCGRVVYAYAAELTRIFGIPIATHIAESIDERRFIAHAEGPWRAMLEQLGFWDDSVAADITQGLTPINHLARALVSAPFLLAHANDCSDADLDVLACTRASVVYCPRSAAYFGHDTSLGPHRYRDMHSRGINVALGTDSIVNIPDGEAGTLSTLDEMRFLYRRDRTDPAVLLRMATINGARALGLDTALFSLVPGPIAGLCAIDLDDRSQGPTPLAAALESTSPARLLFPRCAAQLTVESPGG